MSCSMSSTAMLNSSRMRRMVSVSSAVSEGSCRRRARPAEAGRVGGQGPDDLQAALCAVRQGAGLVVARSCMSKMESSSIALSRASFSCFQNLGRRSTRPTWGSGSGCAGRSSRCPPHSGWKTGGCSGRCGRCPPCSPGRCSCCGCPPRPRRMVPRVLIHLGEQVKTVVLPAPLGR